MERFISFFGLVSMLAVAYLLSSNRKKVNWRTILSGV
ncbi:Na+ dependent nucleoside transporter N-terminal domain-containing protein, partial [Bacteriovorax sp. DB6_IX]